MPFIPPRLTLAIEAEIKAEIMKHHGDAQPGAELHRFSQAIAEGFINTARGTAGIILKSEPNFGSTVVGLTGTSPIRISQNIQREAIASFKAKGLALPYLADGIGRAIVEELQYVTIVGTDAGLARNFGVWTDALMASNMLKASGYPVNQYNRMLFLAISKGISQEIRVYAQVIIPPSGLGAGPSIATLS